MKSVIALATVVLALSLCNLMGRRGNTNDNANSRSSGTSSETSASPSPARNETETSSAPRQDLGSAPPASQQSGPGSSRAGIPPPPPAPATPRPGPPKTISGGVLNGKAISKPEPAYPPIARAAHASGQVTVQVLIDEKGNVVTAQAVSGHPLLKASAEAAARKAKFSPTVLSGQPVKVTGVIVYNFIAQ
jgi:protein TonB